MAETFTGQVIVFGGSFAPKKFALCQGQLMPVGQNTALFSILGTTFGGDGEYNFALPNLIGQAGVGIGQGPGPTEYILGGTYGEPVWRLKPEEMAAHTHSFVALDTAGTTLTAAGHIFATPQIGSKGSGAQANIYSSNLQKATTSLQPASLSSAGGGQPHNNMQPYLPIAMCMCLAGLYPHRPGGTTG